MSVDEWTFAAEDEVASILEGWSDEYYDNQELLEDEYQNRLEHGLEVDYTAQYSEGWYEDEEVPDWI